MPILEYYNCVKFHQYLFTCLGAVAPMRNMDTQRDRQMKRHNV